MRYFLISAFAGMLLLCLGACHKEAPLTPSPASDFYSLPQGNHPYDDSIMAFYKQYGSYMLYKFDTVDYAYNYTKYLSIRAAQGNEAYVPQAIDFFKKQCLNLYPENFLQATMPFKVILASYIDTLYLNTGYARSVTNIMAGRGMLAIGWADSTLQQQSTARLQLLKGSLNRCYFWQGLQSGALVIPPDFAALYPTEFINGSTLQSTLGLIEIPYNVDNDQQASLMWDFLCYIKAITSRTKADLDATILKPSFDTKGLIRKKYAILINYYQTNYGMDLQAVGNHL